MMHDDCGMMRRPCQGSAPPLRPFVAPSLRRYVAASLPPTYRVRFVGLSNDPAPEGPERRRKWLLTMGLRSSQEHIIRW